MYKNQLQELAQRSCFNLPSYSCIREGPDHAPRFKAIVSFNGEVFESPEYYTTLRQAEHAAAEVALNTLSKRGPTQSLAARILDETGVCKNLLQETAQRAGVSLPVYTTMRSGPRHLPLFTCVVEVGGRSFVGEPAKIKKQAEKNAALAAWSALKYLNSTTPGPLLLESSEGMHIGTQHGREDQSSLRSSLISGTNVQRSRIRSVNVRDRNRASRDGMPLVGGHYYPSTQVSSNAATDACGYDRYRFAHGSNSSTSFLPVSGEVSHDAAQKFLYKHSPFAGSWHQHGATSETLTRGQSSRTFHNPQATPGSFSSRRQVGSHHRRHSLSGMESPALPGEAVTLSGASCGKGMLARTSPYPQQIRGLPYQSLSERFELNRPSLLEELQQLKDDEDDWSQQDVMSSSAQPHQFPARRIPWQSQSERFEHRNHFLPQVEEVHGWDEEEFPPPESYGHFDRDQMLENMSSYKEGWLRGNTLLQLLEAQKNQGYREGWLREEIKKQNLNESRHLYRDIWPDGEVGEETKKQNLNESRHLYRDIWPDGEAGKSYLEEASCSSRVNNTQSSTLCGIKESNLIYRDSCNDMQAKTKGILSSSTSPSSPSSPFSSFWAKSTQWWGSHRPSSPSSAAAALASTLGIRPASSMAPAVRVRQAVPVCSAPPRRSDAPLSTLRPPADHHHSSSLADSEANMNQLFNSLRL